MCRSSVLVGYYDAKQGTKKSVFGERKVYERGVAHTPLAFPQLTYSMQCYHENSLCFAMQRRCILTTQKGTHA